MPTITQSVKFDDTHLQDLALKARGRASTKKGYLLKSDPKQKKMHTRYCCVYQNFFFYFESESCTRPLGVVFLESTQCKEVASVAGQKEGGFKIYTENEAAKQYFFCANTEKEREEWVDAISNANITRVQHDLEELRLKCQQMDVSLATMGAELQHLREVNLRAQNDMRRAMDNAAQLSPRRRTSSSNTSQFSTRLSASPIPSKSHSESVEQARGVIHSYVKGWLIRRKWKKVVNEYLKTPSADMIRMRNKLLWKFIASEEDYVSQLTILKEEFQQQCVMAANSRSAPLSLEQCHLIFRNSDELVLLHQLFLRGLHNRIDQWPVVMLGDLLKLFVPMMVVYHEFISSHALATDTLVSLSADSSFKNFLTFLEAKPTCLGMTLEQLLSVPLQRVSALIQDLQELHAHTPQEHVDYDTFQEMRDDLSCIQKAMTDEEMCLQTESIRRVLEVERRMEGGCAALLDKDQTLLREGTLYQARTAEDRTSSLSRGFRLRTQPRVCFLFSKHFLITSRIQKKTAEMYRVVKVLPLSSCTVTSHENCDNPELSYRAIKIVLREEGAESETFLLLAGSITEKAQWLGDFAQSIENEKHLRILESQCQGQPAELSSKFIRYSTFKLGKEQLVNSASLDSLLQRLVKLSHLGPDFLNTFFMTMPLYTATHTVMDFLAKSYRECVERKERGRRASLCPQEAVRGARAIMVHERPRAASIPAIICNSTAKTPPPSPRSTLERSPLREHSPFPSRGRSTSSEESEPTPVATGTITGVFSALKHWICKHFHYFKEDESLAEKAEMLIQLATDCPHMDSSETELILETQRLYNMQQEEGEEERRELEIMKCPQPLPQHPFEQLLKWEARDAAEQLCLIDSALYSRVDRDELLRYFRAKGKENKALAAPHLSAIFDHFNRMSLFFMWSVANQRYSGDRPKLIEFLIQLATECVQLNNFCSFMQVISGLSHGSVQRFKTAWEAVSKPMKTRYRSLLALSSTEGRFKELRVAMRRADPPLVPYLGTSLNELSGVVEALPTRLDDELINFSKMRRCTRLIMDTLRHQKEPYDLTFVPEITKVLLCVPIPGTEDDLYQYVDSLGAK